MAKQTFTTGQVLSAENMTSLQQTAMLGGSATAKSASYTLVAADAGTAITMSNAGATTITVNTGLFAAGDTVTILNAGAGTCTITAGTATVSKPTNATLALIQNAGGVLYFTATGAATFLPFDVGATSSAFVGCSLSKSSDQTISTNTSTLVTWDTEEYDTDNLHSTSTNTSRVTIPAGLGGKYLLVGGITWSQADNAMSEFAVLVNGAEKVINYFAGGSVGNSNMQRPIGYVLNVSAGDYIEIQCRQNSGGNRSIKGNIGSPSYSQSNWMVSKID